MSNYISAGLMISKFLGVTLLVGALIFLFVLVVHGIIISCKVSRRRIAAEKRKAMEEAMTDLLCSQIRMREAIKKLNNEKENSNDQN